MIDLYCERTAPGLIDGPLNVITNLAFFIAAYLLFKRWRALRGADRGILLLVVVIALIGLGSGLLDTLATPVAEMADV